ncbi:transposase [Rhizobium brockwellii]|uniref:transposase n=1 Tax=Rhizobium brockwellii TaxID=3019932 RepID=UPI0013EE635A|nr:transposase [Rhizobium brockwellii]
MGVKRYELNEAQWSRIVPLLPDKSSDPGRTGVDNRTFVNGCLWILRSGAHWQDLPERYGEDGPPPVQSLVPCRRMGASL